jgi:hypothetical protein
MVVGLLTIIYMLGGTFLIVASMDRKQTRSIVRSGQGTTNARGLVVLVQNKLRDDLHLSDTRGVYGELSTGPEAWLGYIDYPADDSRGDFWLSTPYYRGISQWRRLGDLPGAGGGNDVSVSTTSEDYMDVDLDGARDAIRFDSGMVDPDGDTIYAAVRVLDTSGFLNANVAWSDKSMTNPVTPVNLKLKPLTGFSPYGHEWKDLLSSRGGSHNTALSVYYQDAAWRILHPESPFVPFDVAEEAFLRNMDPDGLAHKTEAGRMAEELAANGSRSLYRQLTTRSISRSLLRIPGQMDSRRLALTDSALNDQNTRQWLWQQLVAAGADRTEAAHVVANLWAYTSNADAATTAFAFQPNSNPAVTKVYGIAEQLVISEVFIYSESETTDGADNDGYGIGIELMNPTWRTVNTANYKLAVGASVKNFSDLAGGAPVVAPGGKIVLYYFDGKIGPDDDDAELATFGFDQITATKYEVQQLEDFSAGTSLRIYKEVQVAGVAEQVPIDAVTGSEIGYTVTNKRTHDGLYDDQRGANARRDDSWDEYRPENGKLGGRKRATVAVYKTDTSADEDDHALGDGNGLKDKDLNPGLHEGFAIHRPTSMRNLGELLRLYRTGPDATGVALPQQLKNFKEDPTRGLIDLHDRIGPAGGPYPTLPWAAVLMELVEILPTDTGMADDPRRIYGRININTAQRDVLLQLPWQKYVYGVDGGNAYKNPRVTVDEGMLVDYIIAYRDGTQTPDGRFDFSNRATANGTGGLRAGLGGANGFLTEAEVAIPLHLYARTLKADINDFQRRHEYIDVHGVDRLYHDISNLITVRSDTYAVLIQLQSGDADSGRPVRVRRFLGLIDRSNVLDPDDMPDIVLFTELK